MNQVSQKRLLLISILFLVLSLFPAVIIGCGGGSGGGGDDGGSVTPTGSTVSGIVYDNNGVALDNATVSWALRGREAKENSTTTNIRGEFTFYNVTPGTIAITAVKGSLYNQTTLTVNENSTVETSIDLVPCGQISGLVYDQYTSQFVVDTKITLTRDGNTVATQQTGLDGKYYIKNLPAGEYVIAAGKTGYYGSSSVVNVTADDTQYFEFHLFPITSASPTPSPTSSPAPSFTGKVYSIHVGINDYPSNDLPCCVADAKSIKGCFEGCTMWNGSSITLLTDREATKGAIQAAIENVKNSANSNDRFVMTFSGHGTNSVGRAALCVWNDDADDWAYISDEDLADWLQGMPCSSALFIESCYSGGLVGKNLTKVINGKKFVARVYTGAPGYDPNFKGTFHLKSSKSLEDLSNIVVVTSSRGDEVSWGNTEIGHGVFSYYIIKGLGTSSSVGPADTDGNHSISAEEMYNYVSPKVYDYMDGIQTPQMRDNYSAVSSGLSVKQ